MARKPKNRVSIKVGLVKYKAYFIVQPIAEWAPEQLQAIARNGYVAAVRQLITNYYKEFAPGLKTARDQFSLYQALLDKEGSPFASATEEQKAFLSEMYIQTLPIDPRKELETNFYFTAAILSNVELEEDSEEPEEDSDDSDESDGITIGDAILNPELLTAPIE